MAARRNCVAGAGKTSQPHALEAVVNLQVGKAHLDAFALVARHEECFCSHQPACHVAGIFMNIAGNFSDGPLGRRSILSAQTSQSNLEAR